MKRDIPFHFHRPPDERKRSISFHSHGPPDEKKRLFLFTLTEPPMKRNPLIPARQRLAAKPTDLRNSTLVHHLLAGTIENPILAHCGPEPIHAGASNQSIDRSVT